MIQKLNFYEFVPRNNYNSAQRSSFKYTHFSGKVETKKKLKTKTKGSIWAWGSDSVDKGSHFASMKTREPITQVL